MPRDDLPLRPPEPARGGALRWLLVLAALAAGGWFWWSTRPDAASTPAPRRPVVAAPAPEATVTPTGPKHPVEAPQDGPLGAAETPGALAELLGAQAIVRFLVTEDFARRLVATVDNLGREQAPASHWPVQATPGRFTVAPAGDAAITASANAARYAPFVAWVEGVDAGQAAAFYRRIYPQLQQAWAELGMGDRHLNDRVVEVIDLLLATPVPAAPPALKLTEVKGPVPSTRPWVRYEFVDPALQSLAAGQKILLRVGPENQRRLQARLRALRGQLAAPAS